MVTQLAREFGAYVIGTGRAADRQSALDFGANEFVDLDKEALEGVGQVDLVFDLIGGDIGKRSARLVEPEGRWCPSSDRPRRGPPTAWRSTSLSSPIALNWGDRQRVRDGRLRTKYRRRRVPRRCRHRLQPDHATTQERRSSAFAREDSLTVLFLDPAHRAARQVMQHALFEQDHQEIGDAADERSAG